VPFEEAVELIFRCPGCGEPLTHFDNSALVKFLEKKVEELQRELNE
jgi:transcription initiation factor IIE alpha subunit